MYKIFNFDENNLLSNIVPGNIMEFNYLENGRFKMVNIYSKYSNL